MSLVTEPYTIPYGDAVIDCKSIPYKRLKFLTIKDSRKDAKMITIGRCYDYLKRFSERIWLVMSPLGGIHFHALIILKEDKLMTFKKGIHIRCDDVGDTKNPNLMFDSPEEKIDQATERAQLALQFTGSKECADAAYARVMAGPSKEAQRNSRDRSLTRKGNHIRKIISYLNKNLGENPGVPVKYITYIVK